MSNAFERFVASLTDAGLSIVDRDLEQGPRVTIAHREDVILFELGWRDDESPCYARTERFNVSARPLRRAGGLDDEGRALVERAMDVLRALEDELAPAPRTPPPAARAEVRELRVTRALGIEGHGRYYLNPYVGCMIGCPFCWVDGRSDLGRALEGRPALPWGRWVDVKVNLAEVLRDEVRRLPPGPVRISPVVTDPYQPIERKHRITRRCLEVLLPAGFTPILLTRAKRVLDDLELLSRYRNVAVGVSIPTDDDAVRRAFEPAADPIEDRLDAMRALHEAGVVTFAVVQPVLPMDVERLVELVAPYAAAVRLDRMHEVRRALPLYERAGHVEAASAGFAERTLARLHAAFRERRVPIDDRDDLATLVLEALARRGSALPPRPR
ncbi:MAG TPA: radical SAM protein [Sandaracinaceae bacterium]